MSGRPATLRREIVTWYSVVLLLALTVFSALTFVLMRQALAWSGRASLRQSAEAVEQLVIPRQIARLRTWEDIVHVPAHDAEVIRRRTLLATGDTVVTWFTRRDDVERHALGSLLVIALLLIPLTALLAALGGRALLERLLAPLDRLVDATREIGIGDLSRRVVEPERPAELRELALSFNGMLTRLERAVQALRRFTGDASHELRTPLTSIRGTVQVARSRPRSTAELEETLDEVLEETEWMLNLVEGLLTLARGEEMREETAARPVDLSDLLLDVREVGEALALGRPVEVRAEIAPELVVHGNAGPLRQVFLNLVSNAVKFTERGEVTIAASAAIAPDAPPAAGAPETAAEDWVEVRVRDTGIGILPDELPRVFDRFYRGNAARSQPGGTGLGLAIAKLIVERHGGIIDASSVPGRGSEFRVRLPCARQAEPSEPA